MTQILSFRRLLIVNGVLGVFLGGILALTGRPAEVEAQSKAGCKCTISGSSYYHCTSPNLCGTGFYECSVSCSKT